MGLRQYPHHLCVHAYPHAAPHECGCGYTWKEGK